jgi:hypothetical protein
MQSKLFIILVCLCCLTGCNALSEDCKENICWNASIVKTPCGQKIVDHCQTACDACVFNEPTCKKCMKCVETPS